MNQTREPRLENEGGGLTLTADTQHLSVKVERVVVACELQVYRPIIIAEKNME